MTSAAVFDNLELLLHLDRSAEQSLRNQLIEQLKYAILEKRLAPGQPLPSTRSLADRLGISRNVVVAAYDELFVDGYIARRSGSGTSVSIDLPALPSGQAEKTRGNIAASETGRGEGGGSTCIPPSAIIFRIGIPDISHLPLGIWRSIWKEVSSQLPPINALQPLGNLELRIALSHYLKRTRGFSCEADNIIITTSATQAIDFIARTLLVPGSRVGFEEPGYHWARQTLLARGISIVPLPVDLSGVQTHMLPQSSQVPHLTYVTPSHQFPLGGRLPLERRLQLLEWARSNNSLLIEDDYDSEFRFAASPIAALASLDQHERVLYLGTFSNVLSPALRLGYLILPPHLRRHLKQSTWLPTDAPSWSLQQALLVCLRDSHLERHIRRMRRLYAKKREALKEALAPICSIVQLHGLEAGLHSYLELPEHLQARQVAREASKRGVLLSTLDPFYLGKPDRNGLLLGYGSLTLAEINQGAAILVDVITSMA